MISFIEYLLNEERIRVGKKDIYKLDTVLKKDIHTKVNTPNENKKIESVLECANYFINQVIRGNFSNFTFIIKDENVRDMEFMGYDLTDKNEWSEIAKNFLLPLTSSDFLQDYYVAKHGSWVYEFVYKNWRSDQRILKALKKYDQINNLKRHLYIKFTFRYKGKDVDFPVKRSSDKALYINPTTVKMVDISIHTNKKILKG